MMLGNMLGNMFHPRPHYNNYDPVTGAQIQRIPRPVDNGPRAFATVGAGVLTGALTTFALFDGMIVPGVLSGTAASFVTWHAMGNQYDTVYVNRPQPVMVQPVQAVPAQCVPA